jgi:hypothetical protein
MLAEMLEHVEDRRGSARRHACLARRPGDKGAAGCRATEPHRPRRRWKTSSLSTTPVDNFRHTRTTCKLNPPDEVLKWYTHSRAGRASPGPRVNEASASAVPPRCRALHRCNEPHGAARGGCMATIGVSEAAPLVGRDVSTPHRIRKSGRLGYSVDSQERRRRDPAELGRVFDSGAKHRNGAGQRHRAKRRKSSRCCARR